jgi:hypothetical protein
MRRVVSAVFLLALVGLALPVSAQSPCVLAGPTDPVDMGSAFDLVGDGFDPGTLAILFVDSDELAGGTTGADGRLAVGLRLAAPGEYTLQMFGFAGGGLCITNESALVVLGDGPDSGSEPLPAGFVPDALSSPTIVLSSAAVPTPVTLAAGDFVPLDAGDDVSAATTSTAPATTAATTTSPASDAAAGDVAAEPEDDGTPLLPLASATAVGTVLLGAGAGWWRRRRRVR